LAQRSTFKPFALGVLLTGVAAALAFALTRDKQDVPKPQAQPPQAAVANPAFLPNPKPQRPAFTAAEESYIAALWDVHDKVKNSAVRMTFAGLYFKTGEIDVAELQKRITPQTEVFRAVAANVSALQAPPSFAKLHGDYLEAISLYEQASVEMAKVSAGDADAHLLAAQTKTEKAAVTLLKVGDELWPGEYRPN
jgi:hypothetical protein